MTFWSLMTSQEQSIQGYLTKTLNLAIFPHLDALEQRIGHSISFSSHSLSLRTCDQCLGNYHLSIVRVVAKLQNEARLSFVVKPHLMSQPKDHESLLPELLERTKHALLVGVYLSSKIPIS